MPEQIENTQDKETKDNIGGGLYEKSVRKISDRVAPYLKKIEEEYTQRAIERNAADNPELAKLIRFEVARRAGLDGSGVGGHQDVAEPLLWAGVKTVSAFAIAGITELVKNKKLRPIGFATSLGLLLNNAVELARLIPRFRAGLQGATDTAIQRYKHPEFDKLTPFNKTPGEKEKHEAEHAARTESKSPESKETERKTSGADEKQPGSFASTLQKNTISPAVIMENRANNTEMAKS